MELEVAAGIVSNEAKDSFLERIREEVESNDGEANRIRKDEEEFALAQAKAKDKKEAIDRQSLREVVCLGKGDGKGGKFSQRIFNRIQKNPKEDASVARIVATAIRVEQTNSEEAAIA